MRVVLALVTAAAMVTVLGCVVRTHHTIDARIQVDVRYVEEQADDVLDFIEGESDTLDLDQSSLDPSLLYRAMETFAFFQTAHAQELKSDSDQVRALATKMKNRNPEIAKLKASGCMGEDNRGYVELRECDALKDADAMNAAQRLKSEENADRKALYNEFAQLNADKNLSVGDMERIFARKRLERASAGEIFQLPAAGADFDAFKKSGKGKALGDKCQPGAWVKIP